MFIEFGKTILNVDQIVDIFYSENSDELLVTLCSNDERVFDGDLLGVPPEYAYKKLKKILFAKSLGEL